MLDARNTHPGSTLADLTEAECVAFLFERYQTLTAPLAAAAEKPGRRKKR